MDIKKRGVTPRVIPNRVPQWCPFVYRSVVLPPVLFSKDHVLFSTNICHELTTILTDDVPKNQPVSSEKKRNGLVGSARHQLLKLPNARLREAKMIVARPFYA